jgi:hypothetical protein
MQTCLRCHFPDESIRDNVLRDARTGPDAEDEDMIEIACVCCGADVERHELFAASALGSMCRSCLQEVEALARTSPAMDTSPSAFPMR